MSDEVSAKISNNMFSLVNNKIRNDFFYGYMSGKVADQMTYEVFRRMQSIKNGVEDSIYKQREVKHERV